MKKQLTEQRYQFNYLTYTLLLRGRYLIILLLTLLCSTKVASAQISSFDNDESSLEILRQLNNNKLDLNFPMSVKRAYKNTMNHPLWIVKEPYVQRTWAAMLMMDCVLQFGFNQADLHPKNLLYSTLHDILEQPKKVTLKDKAQFDILLTDAIITFINYLHFGKYNPYISKAKIDEGTSSSFNSVAVLHKALHADNLMETIVNSQPNSRTYRALQDHLHLVAGVQLGDCYEFPEAEVRKIALNMERLRWASLDSDVNIQINIPSYQLFYSTRVSQDTFKVIVGKPGTPTPTFNSLITSLDILSPQRVPRTIFIKRIVPASIKNPQYLKLHKYTVYHGPTALTNLTEATLLKIRQNPAGYYATKSTKSQNKIVFNLANQYDIYLQSASKKDVFDHEKLALSNGCIRIDNASTLALLITKLNGGDVTTMRQILTTGLKKQIFLKKPIQIALTYVTCDIRDGNVLYYDDIYGLDDSLDIKLFRKNDPALKINQN